MNMTHRDNALEYKTPSGYVIGGLRQVLHELQTIRRWPGTDHVFKDEEILVKSINKGVKHTLVTAHRLDGQYVFIKEIEGFNSRARCEQHPDIRLFRYSNKVVAGYDLGIVPIAYAEGMHKDVDAQFCIDVLVSYGPLITLDTCGGIEDPTHLPKLLKPLHQLR
jgi:hypothetical protein